jgi:hypothetical protein
VNQPQNLATKSKMSALTSIWVNSSLAVMVVGLLALNVATLMINDVHSEGYRFLERLIGITVSAATLHDILANSPTQARKAEVESRTKAIRAERDEVAKRHEELAGQHRKLSSDHANLQGKHKKLSVDHSDLKAQSLNRANVVRATSQRIGSRVATVGARGVSSFLARITPGAGAAVSAGVLAWDLADLCETMKALGDLDAAFGHGLLNPKRVCGLTIPSWN